MKKLIITTLLFIITTVAQTQTAYVKSYATGNYIFCGKELPSEFNYIISKKLSTDKEYTVVANIQKPQNKQTLKAKLMALPATIANATSITEAMIDKVFTRISNYTSVDSLYALAYDAKWQYASGCGWFDDNLQQGTYYYKIEKQLSNGSVVLLNEIQHNFPAKHYNGIAQPLRFKTTDAEVEIHYALTDTINTTGIKIYRSKYQENNFEEKDVSVFFSTINNKTVAVVKDNNIIQGVAYSYIAIPYDGLNNTSTPTDTLHIIHQASTKNIGIFSMFQVAANVKNNTNVLTWKYAANTPVHSIDIYRANSYDGNYIKIGSTTAKDTVYTDEAILQPATTYYYYIIANATYAKSFPSARTPAVIQGNHINLLPPQNITATCSGNIVTLQFENTEADTKAFYIYRANGFTAELKPLPTIINYNGNNTITYIDTLPFSVQPNTYTYAVADVNTSYNISELSNTVAVQTSDELPIVTNVNAMALQEKAFISWKNMQAINPAVTAYQIIRTEITENNTTSKEEVIATIAANDNSYTDTLVEEGKMYVYTIKAIGLNKEDIGKPSLPAQCIINHTPLLPPAQISVFNTGNSALLQWNLPQETIYTNIKIYRATNNTAATLIKELKGNTNSFEDKTVQAGTTYFYYVQCETAKQKTNISDAVAVTINN